MARQYYCHECKAVNYIYDDGTRPNSTNYTTMYIDPDPKSYENEDILKFGKYKDQSIKALAPTPEGSQYLYWILENCTLHDKTRQYIENILFTSNIDVPKSLYNTNNRKKYTHHQNDNIERTNKNTRYVPQTNLYTNNNDFIFPDDTGTTKSMSEPPKKIQMVYEKS